MITVWEIKKLDKKLAASPRGFGLTPVKVPIREGWPSFIWSRLGDSNSGPTHYERVDSLFVRSKSSVVLVSTLRDFDLVDWSPR